jgi:hypothetical protein
MFSTFFGGSDASWATPATQYTYYRDMALYAGDPVAGGDVTRTGSPTATGTSGALVPRLDGVAIACALLAVLYQL